MVSVATVLLHSLLGEKAYLVSVATVLARSSLLGCMFWQQGTGLLFRRNVMNTLPLIRSKLKRAELLHSAQLIATSHGATYHDQSALNANSACRKEKFKRLHDAQLISF